MDFSRILGAAVVVIALVLVTKERRRLSRMLPDGTNEHHLSEMNNHYKRRVKSTVMMFAIGCMLFFQPDVDAAVQSVYIEITYLGMLFIFVLVLLGMVARDLRKTATQSVKAQEDLAVDATSKLGEMISEIRRTQEPPENTQKEKK